MECVQGPARPFKHDMSSPLTGLRRGLIELRLSLRSVSPTQKKEEKNVESLLLPLPTGENEEKES